METKWRKQSTSKRKRARSERSRAERRLDRLLLQLIVSAIVFLVVFVGGGLIPDQVFDVFGSVRQVVLGDDALLQSVQALGQAISEGESWPQAVRDWCVETFLPADQEESARSDIDGWLSVATAYHSHLLPQRTSETEQSLTEALDGP